MITRWHVRLEVARDDDGPLSDEGIRELTRLLTESGAQPVLTRGDSGTVFVQVTVDAKNDQVAKGEAENVLRARAQEVWTALRLPPFTIAFIDATQDDDPSPPATG